MPNHHAFFCKHLVQWFLWFSLLGLSTLPVYDLCVLVAVGALDHPLDVAQTAWAVISVYMWRFGGCFIIERQYNQFFFLQSISCFIRWTIAMVLALGLPVLIRYGLSEVWFRYGASRFPEEIAAVFSVVVPGILVYVLFVKFPTDYINAMRNGTVFRPVRWG